VGYTTPIHSSQKLGYKEHPHTPALKTSQLLAYGAALAEVLNSGYVQPFSPTGSVHIFQFQ